MNITARSSIDDANKYIPPKRELIEYEVCGGHSVSRPDKKATITPARGVIEFFYTNDYDIEPLYNTAIYQAALADLIKAMTRAAVSAC